ncbi:hypothetical protein SCALM49S_09593 [Streptomyces californicus]
MQAQVHGGGLARRGEDASAVHVEDVGVDRDAGVSRGQLPGVGPVRGGAAAVQQPRGGQGKAPVQREATRAPASWAARTASTSAAGGSRSMSAQPGTITVPARARASSPSSGVIRKRPTRTGPGPQSWKSYQDSAPAGACEPKTSPARDSSKCSMPSVTARATVPCPKVYGSWRSGQARGGCPPGQDVRDEADGIGRPRRRGPPIGGDRPAWSRRQGERSWHRASRWRCTARTVTPGGSSWRNCWSGGSPRCSPGGTPPNWRRWRGRPARRPARPRPTTRRRWTARWPGLRPSSTAPGPSAAQAAPVIEAALRAGIPYLDVAAEIEANADTFERFAERALEAETVVVPAMAFFGGLGDLLVTAAMGGRTAADEVHVAYGLSSWHPTAGAPDGGRGVPAAAGRAARRPHRGAADRADASSASPGRGPEWRCGRARAAPAGRGGGRRRGRRAGLPRCRWCRSRRATGPAGRRRPRSRTRSGPRADPHHPSSTASQGLPRVRAGPVRGRSARLRPVCAVASGVPGSAWRRGGGGARAGVTGRWRPAGKKSGNSRGRCRDPVSGPPGWKRPEWAARTEE